MDRPDLLIQEVAGPVVDVGFDGFYRQEYDRMVRAAYLMMGSQQSAEEIVQDAFVRVHLRWAKLDSPAAFLRTCVINGCRDRLRRRTRLAARVTLLAATPDAQIGSPTDGDGVELYDVLLTLPHRQRAAIVGRFYCGWDDDALAQVLGVRPATVRSLVHRGLSALRIELSS
ncbi:MAG: sigma-70 family RNA polymerase sigma factor [Actinobacteria bacterium]|nr:sigma-70 family RNA polymerase sigma factor [Actinomycetota bacterium]